MECALGLFFIVAVVFAYQPAWHAGFIWDDDEYVTNNPLIVATDGLRRIWFSTDAPSQYFPLTYTTLRVEHAFFGFNAAGYHWINILLHGINAILLWRLLKRLSIAGAWLAAGIFALHPVAVESVAWISELKSVLSLFFMLLASRCWIEVIERPQVRKWYWLGFACFLLALSSKTTACTLPAAMLLVLWLKKIPIDRPRLLQLVPFIAASMGMGLLTMWWERNHIGTHGPLFSLGMPERILIASHGMWFYPGKLFWPVDLAFSYPKWVLQPSDPLSYGWLIAAIGLGVVIYRLRRRFGRGPEVALLFFLSSLLPVLGFIMLYTFRYTYVADHYQYVAGIGLITLAAAGLTIALTSYPLCRITTYAAILITLGTLTWRQCRMYTDGETLWRTTLQKNPRSDLALDNLGFILLQKGDLDDAFECYQKLLKLQPKDANACVNLGFIYDLKGDRDNAMHYYQEALSLEPNNADAHIKIGNVLSRQGRTADAFQELQKALQTDSGYAPTHKAIADLYFKEGKMDDAVLHYREALKQQPDSGTLNNLGNALYRLGKLDEAVVAYRKALDLAPDNELAQNNLGNALLDEGQAKEAVEHFQKALALRPDYTAAQKSLAFVLAACPDPSLRDGPQAVELAERADRATDHQNPQTVATLAAAYAQNGRFSDAVSTAQRALRFAEAGQDQTLADALRNQVKLYQSGQPLRDPTMTNRSSSRPINQK